MSRKTNSFFQFKQFRIDQERAGMKVTTEACILGGIVSDQLKPKRILDIGAGTGLLSLMLAQKFPRAAIVAVELDNPTYLQAVENVKKSSWKDRIEVVQSAIQEYPAAAAFDLIICNPPFYVDSLTSPDPQVNLARHAYTLASHELAHQIRIRLAPGGCAYVLYPQKENEVFLKALDDLRLQEVVSIYNQPGDTERIFRQISRISFQEQLAERNKFFIRNEQGDYSETFKKLLTDYYLYL